MKFLLIFFMMFICFLGFGENFNLNQNKNGFEGVVLLSNDHVQKIALINKINRNYYPDFLKSAETKYELDTIFTQQWNEDTQTAENYLRYNYDFENEGKKVNVKIYAWNKDENGWRIADAAYYYFNEDNLLEVAEFHHYIGFLYRTFAKTEYSYENNVPVSETYYEKTDEDEEWEIKSGLFYEYDSLQRLTSAVLSEWEDYDEIWLERNKHEFSYFENDQIKESKEYLYEFYERYWIPQSKTVYARDSLQRISGFSMYIYGSDTTTLWEDEKWEYQYDSQNRKASRIKKEYNYDEDAFVPQEKWEFQYELPNVLFQELSHIWDNNQQIWITNTLKNYLSIHNFSMEEVLFFPFIEVHYPVFVFDGIVCEKIENIAFLNEISENAGIVFYKFSPKIASEIPSIQKNRFEIYPNPVIDRLFIKSSADALMYGELYNSQGKLVLDFQFSLETSINLKNRPTGIYFLKLFNKGREVLSEKVIKF